MDLFFRVTLLTTSFPTLFFPFCTFFQDGCRYLNSNMDPSIQECHFYQTTLRGSYVGTTNHLGDVIDFLRQTIDGQTLVESLNEQQDEQSSNNNATTTTTTTTSSRNTTTFVTKFMGVPQSDIDEALFGSGSDQGREHLGEATNLENYQTSPPGSQDRTTITIVGGLLVAAFTIVFVSVLVILWRRRQAYLNGTNTVRHVELSNDTLDKLSVVGEGGGGGGGGGNGACTGSDPDLEHYNTSNTDEDEEEVDQGGHPNNNNNSSNHHPDMSRDSSLYINKDDDTPPLDGHINGRDDVDDDDDDDLPSPTDDGLSETMQFDLGNSFKDQLLGLHGFSGHGQSQQLNHDKFKRGGILMSNVMFRQSGQSLDGDSDADSWAQTDGTIGSLELQLEPITAEV
jgi:hypothetical protein